MTKFRKKPVVVDAVQFFYDGPRVPGVFYPGMSEDGRIYIGDAYVVTIHGQRAYLQNGDWVITEPDGEHHYPCKSDIFEATYEEERVALAREMPDEVRDTIKLVLQFARFDPTGERGHIIQRIDRALAWLKEQPPAAEL